MEKIIKIDVELEGIVPIMFNRFIDHSKEVRPPEQKLYLNQKQEVVLPSENIMSMLCGWLVPGIIKKTEKGKSAQDTCDIAATHISVKPTLINFTRKKKNIVFKSFDDPNTWGICMSGGVTKAGGGQIVKQEAQPRPYLLTPWALNFEVTLIKNPRVDENKLYSYFENGGIVCALGTFRPRYGRFVVSKWDKK